MKTLPWDWEQKLDDFIKPGDEVLDLGSKDMPAPLPAEDSAQIVLSRGPLRDYSRILRILRPGGFFLMECVGGEDCRALANFLVPGSRPGNTVNLENQLPLMRAAGFRIMYRDQAYRTRTFGSREELLAWIAAFPDRFPGFSPEACKARLDLLDRSGPLEAVEHLFLLIGKKQ